MGLVEFEPNQGKKTPAVRGLTVGLRLTNAGLTRKIPYTGWGGASPDAKPILRDDNGKSYALTSSLPACGRGRIANLSAAEHCVERRPDADFL